MRYGTQNHCGGRRGTRAIRRTRRRRRRKKRNKTNLFTRGMPVCRKTFFG
jgi:hypothetical protein